MKILRKLSEEKGSITMTVVAAMLFITSAILIAYFSLSNQSNDQSKKTRKIADSYKVTNSDLVQKYKEVQDNLNEIATMSIIEAKALGNIMLAKGTNTETMDTDGNKIIIPGGFKIVEEENVVTDKVENGFVIEDKNQNQWVWIPVSSEDLAKMYVEDSTGWNMLGTSGDTAVYTKLRTRELTTQNTFKLGNRELNRTNPGLTASPSYREPDVLSSYDTDQTYRTQAGFGNLADMATKLKDDYKDMIESVRENGGFYIGRYELGNGKNTNDENDKPQVKAGTVMSEINWYELYKACKSFSSGNVQSRMIWGCQWDQVCRFISTLGDNKVSSLDDSTSYGNYSGSTDGKTGTRNNCITNNIYDLAGNSWEWTQEAYDTRGRAGRGRQLQQWWFRLFSFFSFRLQA